MFNIGAFSKLSNTSIQTLRYYDTLGLLKPSEVGEFNNYRSYTNAELITVRIIKKLKRMKFSLKEISIILNNYDEKDLLKQKELLKTDINSNLKSIQDIEEIISKMKNKRDFKKEMISLINKKERSVINMREQYAAAKEKLLKCYELYNNADGFEECLILLEELSNQIFNSDSAELDPFWANSAGDLFAGITLEVIKNNKPEEVTFLSIFHFKINSKEYIDNLTEYTNTLEKDSYSYLSLSGISSSPADTKGSIISVFKQKMKQYAMFDTKK